MMHLGRSILTLLVALSIAVLPGTAGFASAVKSAPAIISEASSDCAHHHGKLPDSNKAADDCASMAACALKCFNYAGAAVFDVVFRSPAAVLPPPRTDDAVAAQIGHPPFRPPRA